MESLRDYWDNPELLRELVSYQNVVDTSSVEAVLRVVHGCILDGMMFSENVIPNIYDEVRLSQLLPDFDYCGTFDESYSDYFVVSNKTIWKYNPKCEDSAVVRYTEYLINTVKAGVLQWLLGYCMSHRLDCADHPYYLGYCFGQDNPLEIAEWSTFLDYTSHLITRIIVHGIDRNCFEIRPRTPYERYAVAYVLDLFKDELGIQVFYNSATANSKMAVKCYREHFPDVRFDDVFERNFTKEILNLSPVDHEATSHKFLEGYLDSYMIVHNTDLSSDEDIFNRKIYDTEL